MSNDARIMTSLPAHPKTRKLIRRHGQAAAWNLICLFLFARDNKPDGDFAGMDAEDVELAADWQGAPGEFVATLIDVGFLDDTGDGYTVHGWAEHNPWAAGSKGRSESAKQNAAKRWAKRYGTDATGINPHSGPHESAMPPAETGNAPSPIPTPTPIPTPKEKSLVAPKARPSRKAPTDFTVTAEMLDWAVNHAPGVNIQRETEAFLDHTFATGKTDWLGTWRNWLRRSSRDTPRQPVRDKSPADRAMRLFHEAQANDKRLELVHE